MHDIGALASGGQIAIQFLADLLLFKYLCNRVANLFELRRDLSRFLHFRRQHFVVISFDLLLRYEDKRLKAKLYEPVYQYTLAQQLVYPFRSKSDGFHSTAKRRFGTKLCDQIRAL